MSAYNISGGKKQTKGRTAGHRMKLGWQDTIRRIREPEIQNLIAVALVSLFLGFWLVHRYSLGIMGVVAYAKGYRSTTDPPWLVDATKRDPKIGSVIKLPDFVTLEGKKISLPHRQGLTVLAFTGNCTACAARDSMNSAQELAKRFPNIKFYLVIMSGDVALVRSLLPSGDLAASIVVDLNGDVGMHLNAIFQFRRYVFGPGGQLLYLTHNRQATTEFEHDLAAIATQHGGGAQ